jgi:predicted Zn-ribbon and HTH transcriptional regulator
MDDEFFIPPPPGVAPSGNTKIIVEASTPQAIVDRIAIERSYRKVENVTVHECRCQRCPHVWHTLLPHKPKTCPGCHSAWWDTPKKSKFGALPAGGPEHGGTNGKKKKKKQKATPMKVKRPVGRPRKNVVPALEKGWGTPEHGNGPQEVPEIPVELLGAVGEPQNAPDEGGYISEAEVADPFPVATPFNTGVFEYPFRRPQDGPPVEVRQPVHVGGSQNPPVEREPETTGIEPPPIPELDYDDDWHPS